MTFIEVLDELLRLAAQADKQQTVDTLRVLLEHTDNEPAAELQLAASREHFERKLLALRSS